MSTPIPIFVATRQTQGQRDNDFCFVPEGEIVTFPVFTCTGEEADGACGCRRSLCGVHSSTGTTTVKVALLEGGRPARELVELSMSPLPQFDIATKCLLFVKFSHQTYCLPRLHDMPNALFDFFGSLFRATPIDTTLLLYL